MTRIPHISLCPIAVDSFACDWSGSLPLQIVDSISVADVSNIVQETTFDILSPMFYSKSEIDRLRSIRYALLRRFECEDSERPLEDEKSADALYRLYLGLKVIRPTAGAFQVLHYDLSQTVPRLPRGSRNNRETIVSDCERLNAIRWKDLEALAKFAPSILESLKTPSSPIAQAIQSLEIGYRADFVNVRHLLWVIGLDALFTSIEWENRGADVAVKRIENFLGRGFEIYPKMESFGFPSLDKLTLGEVLTDVYEFRNNLAHGTWPNKPWARKISRRSADGLDDIYYTTVLSESASSILRGCLKNIFAEEQFVGMFNDKTKMNAYFAQRDLVRKRKAKATAT